MLKSKNIFKILLLFILFFLSGNNNAQIKSRGLLNQDLINNRIVIQNWNIDNGLPNDRIYSLKRDKLGFLWIGTDNSLVRFDGKEFKVYNHSTNQELKNSVVSGLSFGADGSLWFRNGYNGLIKKQGRKFENIRYDKQKIEHITCIANDLSDVLWVGTLSSGLFYLSKNKLIKFSENFEANQISVITVDKQNSIWVGTKNYGIYKISDGKVIDKIDSPFFNLNRVSAIFVDSKSRIWAGTGNGLIQISHDPPKKTYSISRFSNYEVTSFFEDDANHIWMATKKHGLLIYNNAYLINFTKKHNLSQNNITGLIAADDGIWVATFNGDLSHIRNSQIFTVSHKQGLTNSYVNSIYEDFDGSILIGTYMGIYRLQKNTKQQKVVQLNILKNNHIYAIGRDKESNLVLGTRNKGLFVFKKDKVINYTILNGLNSNFVRCVFFDDNNSMWVGTNSGGISVFSRGKITKYNKKNGLSSNLISFIHKAKDGKYWIGTSGGGINIIDADNNIRVLNDKNGLSGNIISSIDEEPSGIIWLTINGGGLTRIDGQKVENFNMDDGLYTNKLLNIANDKFGKLWFGTPKGIFFIKKNDLQLYLQHKIKKINYNLYGENDGMLSERCIGASMQTLLAASNGQIYVSTSNGLVEVNPKLIRKPEPKIKVYLDEILVNYKKTKLKELSSIGPGIERIEFKFGAVDFFSPNEIEYFCKLSGLDNNWVNIGKQRSVSYAHLSYGNYKFLVKAVNKGISKESNIAEIRFYLNPYFYQTLIFKFVSSLFLLGLIIGLTRYFYLRKYKQELRLIELENVVEKERMRISKDMHDDIGSVLTKINLLSEIAKRDIANKKKLTNELNQINAAGREVVDTLDEIVWALNPKNDNIENLISYIVIFAEDYLALAGIELRISVPEEIPDLEIRAEFRHNLFMVIKESLNNIVKYSGTKCVNIPIEITDNKLAIKIENEGKRIDFDKINKFSNGIKNMKSRITEINGKYIIENFDKGVKTKITVNF